MVFVGVPTPPAGDFPTAGARYTKIAQTPVIREKPYLFVDASGNPPNLSYQYPETVMRLSYNESKLCITSVMFIGFVFAEF